MKQMVWVSSGNPLNYSRGNRLSDTMNGSSLPNSKRESKLAANFLNEVWCGQGRSRKWL